MIGHFLATLTDAQLDLVLTMPMAPFTRDKADAAPRCLVTTVSPTWGEMDAHLAPHTRARHGSYRWSSLRDNGTTFVARHAGWVPVQYDDLCLRFGVLCVNAAIRNRALRVLASRQPAPAPQPMMAEVSG